MEEITRARDSYNNLDSYDDEVSIVNDLLTGAKRVENELLEEFKQVLIKLCELYNQIFPFYYPHNVLNEAELEKLILSLNYDTIDTEIQKYIDYASAKLERLQTEKIVAWLILDYELTAQKTTQSIGTKYQDLLSLPAKQEIITQSWCDDNKTFLDRIKANTKDMDEKLRYVIVEGIRCGWSMDKMTEVFREITGAAAYKAQRLIRTETMAVYGKATRETFLANGVRWVEIIGDAACGGICSNYVGQKIDLLIARVGKELPPYHPNCACSFCAYNNFSRKSDKSDLENISKFNITIVK